MRDWSHYPERYWIDVTAHAHDAALPTENDGFLWPSSLHAHTGRTIIPTRQLPDCPCLILLGESGSGKTCEFDRLNEARSSLSKTLLLGTVTTGPEIVQFFRELLTATPVGILNVALDGWDECILPVPNLSKIIRKQLECLPLDRLRLRLASRTGNWTQAVQEAILAPFIERDLSPRTFAICPFLRSDVKQLARNSQLDADEFITGLRTRDATPLAAYPQPLKLLLKVAQGGGQLPATKNDLYVQGIRTLLDEPNEAMHGRSGSESADRALVAKAAAVATLLTGRPVLASTRLDNPPLTAVRFEELLSMHANFREADYRETLGSALFRSAGPGLHSWAHRSFAEFLAAKYIVDRQLPVRQIDQLLNHAADRGRVAPQLEGVASWLAALHPEYASLLASRQPDVLLVPLHREYDRLKR